MSKPCFLSRFRSRFITSVLLTAFVAMFLPVVGEAAQQVTAVLHSVQGTVLVDGLVPLDGIVLVASDVIETLEDSSVVVELSDGSQIEIGANTQVELALLIQTDSGARESKIKLAWGWMRAKLSPGHQNDASKFEIETANALVGVKFSQPDVEVSYVLDKRETTALAHTVELLTRNLLTAEEGVVPVGSTVIITDTALKIFAGLIEAGSVSSSISTGTKVAIGAGAVALVGVGIALASGGNEENTTDKTFTGTFGAEDPGVWRKTISLTQTGDILSGWVRVDYKAECPDLYGPAILTGEVLSPTEAIANPEPATLHDSCSDSPYELPNPFELRLEEHGNTLYVIGEPWDGITFERE